MAAYLHYLIDFTAAHAYWAYALVFLLALAEAAPIIGTVVPGSPIILAISALVPSGAVELWPLVVLTAAGAAGGDMISYWVGHRYHRDVLELWPFRKKPQLYERGQAFFREHGPKSVFLSRFVRGPHAVVPLIAGIMHMPLRPFMLMNIASALIWAPLHTVTGVLLGASLTLAGAVAGRLAVSAIVLIATLWLIAWLVRTVLRRGLPWIIEAQERLWRWARARSNWLSRVLLSVLDPEQREIRGLGFAFVLMLAATWLFVSVLEAVITGDPLVRADVAVYHFLQGLRTTWGDQIMIRVTELGDSAVTFSLTIVVAAYLLSRRAWRAAVYWVVAVAFAAVFAAVIKIVLRIPRPEVLYSGWSTYSFPSSHATINTTLYGFAALLIGREIAPQYRGPLIAITAITVGAIDFSRLYLGAHWFSDVIAGMAFAVAWIALLGIAYLRRSPPDAGARGLIVVLLVGLGACGGYHVATSFASDTERYAVGQKIHTLPAELWWQTEWRILPPRRLDLTGAFAEPIRLQWGGLLLDLKHQLVAHGWHAPVPWTANSALAWFMPSPDPHQLPVLPRLHDGRPPNMVMVHNAPTDAKGHPRRMVLRLWRSHTEIRTAVQNTFPIWLATVAEQRFIRPLSFMTLTQERADTPAAQHLLAVSLSPSRVVHRKPQLEDGRRDWNGNVILAHARGLEIRPPNGTRPLPPPTNHRPPAPVDRTHGTAVLGAPP